MHSPRGADGLVRPFELRGLDGIDSDSDIDWKMLLRVGDVEADDLLVSPSPASGEKWIVTLDVRFDSSTSAKAIWFVRSSSTNFICSNFIFCSFFSSVALNGIIMNSCPAKTAHLNAVDTKSDASDFHKIYLDGALSTLSYLLGAGLTHSSVEEQATVIKSVQTNVLPSLPTPQHNGRS